MLASETRQKVETKRITLVQPVTVEWAVKALKKSFLMIYSKTHLSSRERVPLRGCDAGRTLSVRRLN